MYVQVAWAQLRASHVQHIKHIWHATFRVPLGTKGQLSYQAGQSINRMYCNFVLLAESLTDEGGEETGVPGENPHDKLQKMPHTKAQIFKPKPRLEPAL